MSVGEYVAVFVSIILGIALGDLALSAHRLLRARERIEWHWLTPALAFFMLLNIIAFWWWSFTWYRELEDLAIRDFLPDVAFFVLLFLATAAVLPDEVPAGRFSLKEFYFREARYFWSLSTLMVLLIIFHLDWREAPDSDWRSFLRSQLNNIVSLIVMVPLLLTKRPWVHYSVIALLMLMIGSAYLFQTMVS